MFVLTSVPGAAHTLCDRAAYVICHIRPVIYLSKSVIHLSLSDNSSYQGICGRCKGRFQSGSGTKVWIAPSTIDPRTRTAPI